MRHLSWAGFLLGGAGAMLAVTGALLPWAQLTVFGWEIALPGILWGAGAATAFLALLSLFALARLPAIAGFLGLACFVTVALGRPAPPREVVRRLLELRRTLAPVNAKLEQATLAPIEPFGAGVGRAADHAGPGGSVALWGAALLTLGGAARFAGLRENRRCGGCRTLWPASRLEGLRFCPSCGVARFPGPHCNNCGDPLATGDRFCVRCGTSENQDG